MKNKVLALLTGAMLMMATSAMADSFYIGGHYSSIASVVNGVHTYEGGGSIDTSTLNGVTLPYVYCVDLLTNIYVPATYNNTTVNNSGMIHGSVVNNAGEVAYLLAHYATGGQGDQAIALQAAIWNVINGYSIYHLDTDLSNSTVVALYNQYVQEAATHTGNIADFLWLNPANYGSSSLYQGQVTAAPVPEPGTMMLLGFGMLGLAIYGKRRMNKEE